MEWCGGATPHSKRGSALVDELAGRRSHMRSRTLGRAACPRGSCRAAPCAAACGGSAGGLTSRPVAELANFAAARQPRTGTEPTRATASWSLQKQRERGSLPRERAKPPQIEAFKVAIDQVRLALEDDCTALTSSSVLQTLFTKSIGAAIHFNRSDSRLENDPEQGALFETIAIIEEVVKTPAAEAALLKAGVVKAAAPAPVLLSTEDDVECREAAVSCLIGAPRPAYAPRPARAPRPAGWPTHTRGILVRQS